MTLSIKPKRMKMPLATFEGAIRVGQEKAAIAEEITLTFGYAEAVVPPPAPPAAEVNGTAPTKPTTPSATPLRAAASA